MRGGVMNQGRAHMRLPLSPRERVLCPVGPRRANCSSGIRSWTNGSLPRCHQSNRATEQRGTTARGVRGATPHPTPKGPQFPSFLQACLREDRAEIYLGFLFSSVLGRQGECDVMMQPLRREYFRAEGGDTKVTKRHTLGRQIKKRNSKKVRGFGWCCRRWPRRAAAQPHTGARAPGQGDCARQQENQPLALEGTNETVCVCGYEG